MTAVIQFVSRKRRRASRTRSANPEHYLWMIGFLLLATRRPSVLTADFWVCRRLSRQD
jgi:hypothetical protein